jgi:hypothetical protein
MIFERWRADCCSRSAICGVQLLNLVVGRGKGHAQISALTAKVSQPGPVIAQRRVIQNLGHRFSRIVLEVSTCDFVSASSDSALAKSFWISRSLSAATLSWDSLGMTMPVLRA